MVTAVRKQVRGLSAEDLETIRDALAAGRRPKVQFTDAAGQVAGQIGQVVQLTDPELSEEWVVVRFGRDELPFSPADLRIPTKSVASRRGEPAGPSAAAPAAARRGEPVGSPTPAPPPLSDKPLPTARQEPTVSDAPTSLTHAPAASAPADNGAASSENGKAARKSAAGRAPKAKAPAALTVTLAYAQGEWTVAAQQGTKALAKPYLVRPSEALRMVGMLDAPGVHEVVDHIVSAERAEAEHRAERLRNELAEIEARLADLREAR